jgi:hypothetical protein
VIATEEKLDARVAHAAESMEPCQEGRCRSSGKGGPSRRAAR